VKQAALELGLPVLQPPGLKAADAVAQLAELHPDVIVVAAYGQLLPPPVLEIPRYGSINIHPSLLPRYRGASPVPAAILAGDDFTGVSIMLMDSGLDTGPVLAQAQVAVSPDDTTGSLTEKLSQVAAPLLLDVLLRRERGGIVPQPQDEAGATLTAPIAKEDGEIDWRRPAPEIARRVRAFQPWPGSFTRWQGRRLEIVEAVPSPAAAGSIAVGQVVALERDDVPVGIVTGDGILGVLKLQLEGKRALTAAEFLRGQRQFVGSLLPG
jgi:methionyl-tRNA formyltransferase